MIDWIETGGGPPICGEPDILLAWLGTTGSSVGEKASDYDRACAVVDYIGRIPCGAGTALVLGDEPLRSGFFVAHGQLLIARWWSCPSIHQASQLLQDIPSHLPEMESAIPFRTASSSLVLFDAAYPGPEPLERRVVALEPGTYSVTSETYEQPGTFRFLIHRFLRKEPLV